MSIQRGAAQGSRSLQRAQEARTAEETGATIARESHQERRGKRNARTSTQAGRDETERTQGDARRR